MTKYIEPFAKKFRGDEFGNLAPFGMATAVKITSTSWIASGNGLT